MSKHTSGPWITDTEAIFSESGRRIAKIVGANSTETDEEFVEIEANARLIAAAPMMLEALEAARLFIENGIEMGYISEPQPGTPESATLPAIKAAIKAAKGEV